MNDEPSPKERNVNRFLTVSGFLQQLSFEQQPVAVKHTTTHTPKKNALIAGNGNFSGNR
jgi:hypothetical protein